MYVLIGRFWTKRALFPRVRSIRLRLTPKTKGITSAEGKSSVCPKTLVYQNVLRGYRDVKVTFIFSVTEGTVTPQDSPL